MARNWDAHNDYCAGKDHGVKKIGYDADTQTYTYAYQPNQRNENTSDRRERRKTVGESVSSHIRESLMSAIRGRRNTTASSADYNGLPVNDASHRKSSRSPTKSTSKHSSRDSMQQSPTASRPPPYSDRYRNSTEEPRPPSYQGRRRRFTTFEQLPDQRMVASPRHAEEYEAEGQGVMGKLGRRLSTRRGAEPTPTHGRSSLQPERRDAREPRERSRRERNHERPDRSRHSSDRSTSSRRAREQESSNGEGMLSKIGRALSVRKSNTKEVHRRATVSGHRHRRPVWI
jgi:hypothetical protein